jgi:primosomal protein N'
VRSTFLEKITARAIIQTRNFQNEVIQTIHHDDVHAYMNQEDSARKMFHYPPYQTILKITTEVSKAQTREVVEYFETIFKLHDPDVLIKKSKQINTVIVQLILRVEPRVWLDPHHDLHHILTSLGKEFIVEINPESVL